MSPDEQPPNSEDESDAVAVVHSMLHDGLLQRSPNFGQIGREAYSLDGRGGCSAVT